MTEDRAFRIASQAGFLADLDGFCDAFGYPRFAGLAAALAEGRPDDWTHTEFVAHLRFDLDFLRIVVNTGTDEAPDLLDRGLHVNARMSTIRDTEEARAALDALVANIDGFFASLPTTTNDAAAPLVGGQSWHTTGATVLIDPAPSAPKRVWA